MQVIFLKIRNFERGLPKNPKKFNFIFFPNPVPFNARSYQNKRSLELVTNRSSGYETSSKEIPLLVLYYLTKFDDVT